MRVVTFTVGGEAKANDFLGVVASARKGGRGPTGYVIRDGDTLEIVAQQIAGNINSHWCTGLYEAKAKGNVVTVKCADGADDVAFSWYAEHLVGGDFLRREDGGASTIEIEEL